MKCSVILLLVVLTAISMFHTPTQTALGGNGTPAAAPIGSHVTQPNSFEATGDPREASPPAVDPDPCAPFLSSVQPRAY